MLFMSLLVDWIQPRRNQWASGYVSRSFSNLKAKWKSKNIYEMWETCKRYNISIMWIPEREQREIKAEDIFKEMIAENFPKLMADTKSQIQENQIISRGINTQTNNRINKQIIINPIQY